PANSHRRAVARGSVPRHWPSAPSVDDIDGQRVMCRTSHAKCPRRTSSELSNPREACSASRRTTTTPTTTIDPPK
ncbi:unnamed protein product, partial [Closterium sp. Naga37s-1]